MTCINRQLPLLSNEERTDDKRIDAGPEEYADRISGAADDRLAKPVKRCIDEDRNASPFPEGLE